jgi:hypothetical protein
MPSDLYDAGAPCADLRLLAELRAAALRCGAALGWAPAEVASFAAARCGRPWVELGPDDLGRVLEEYERLCLAVLARSRRPAAAARRGGRHAVRA